MLNLISSAILCSIMVCVAGCGTTPKLPTAVADKLQPGTVHAFKAHVSSLNSALPVAKSYAGITERDLLKSALLVLMQEAVLVSVDSTNYRVIGIPNGPLPPFEFALSPGGFDALNGTIRWYTEIYSTDDNALRNAIETGAIFGDMNSISNAMLEKISAQAYSNAGIKFDNY